MFNSIKLVRKLTSKKQNKYFILIQIFIVISAIFEVLSIFSILPFISYIIGETSINNEKYFNLYKTFFKDIDQSSIVYISGLVAISIFIISTLLSIIVNTVTIYFSNKIAASISNNLYMKYLNKEWLFHVINPAPKLISRISNDASKINRILVDIFNVNSNIIKTLFIILSIFIFNYKIALILFVIFSLTYTLLYFLLKTRLYNEGEKLSDDQKNIQKRMTESFGVIKEILISNNQDIFLKYFSKDRNKISNRESFILSASFIPRFFIETLGVSVTLLLMLYYYSLYGGINQAIVTLSIFAFASLKLIPNFQQIFFSLAEIKGYSASFIKVENDLLDKSYDRDQNHQSNKKIELDKIKIIKFKDVIFNYPQSSYSSLEIKDLNISLRSKIGVVGESGSGKTTLINILTGLIKLKTGKIFLDDQELKFDEYKNFQSKIGIVPQNIFLFNDTIANNISMIFDTNKNKKEKMKKIVKICDLESLINQTTNGLDALVGEKGVNLSGGQKQKIGIARSLYANKELLIFDEATNSMDAISENLIMDNITSQYKDKTIILISHNYSNIKNFDQIIFFDSGKIRNKGSFNYLIKNDDKFEKLANLKE